MNAVEFEQLLPLVVGTIVLAFGVTQPIVRRARGGFRQLGGAYAAWWLASLLEVLATALAMPVLIVAEHAALAVAGLAAAFGVARLGTARRERG